MYFAHSNNDQHRFLTMFDDAKVQECYRRAESIVPQQALALENGKLSYDAAAKIAQHLTGESDEAFVRSAFQLLLANMVTEDEVAACLQAMAEWRRLFSRQDIADLELRVRSNLVLSLINHNDFVTVR
jgi:hypothetical protein